ncbi:MAG: metal ABC transporter substrate-binding protein [Oscillospiraceae bacterium]|jgi:zinc transport system substrate-binding protein|nr:metal ABC transporter substrate-binding protein [Oscillospiraceae bacterium]
MRKRRPVILSLLSLAGLLAGLLSCAPLPQRTPGKLSVVATIFPPYDFAREIAGDLADVSMLLPPAAEAHAYEPSPQDIAQISACDVFLYVGGDSDAWVENVLKAVDPARTRVVTLMDCVAPLEEETVEGMQAEAEASYGPEYDEHVWTAPQNAVLIAAKIADALCAADPNHAASYRQRTAAYQAQLKKLDADFRAVIADGKRDTLVFGDRFPFRYFAEAYGLRYYAAFPGCSTETEPSVRTVIFLIEKIRAEAIPAVFHAELSNERMADTIAKDTGAQVLLLYACHNISKADFAAGESYLSLMRKNLTALETALG